jgi:hypothetical protein
MGSLTEKRKGLRGVVWTNRRRAISRGRLGEVRLRTLSEFSGSPTGSP